MEKPNEEKLSNFIGRLTYIRKDENYKEYVSIVSYILFVLIFTLICLNPINAQTSVGFDHSNFNVKQTYAPVSNSFSLVSQQGDWSMARKFWLHFGIGPGYAVMKSDLQSGVELKCSGASMLAELGLGIYLNNNQVVFADFFGQTLFDPTLKLGGQEYPMPGDISVTWSGAGIGYGYYFEPQRWLIKGSVGADRLAIDEDDETIAETKSGFYGTLSVGKEWLISQKVSLGVAAHGHIGTMKDKEVNGFSAKWKASGFGVTATLTWVPRGLKP